MFGSTPSTSTGDVVHDSTLSTPDQISTEEVSESTNPFEVSDSEVPYVGPEIDDLISSLPDEVKDANVEIDFLVYIEGQDNVKNDIGNYCWDETDPNYEKYKWHPKDVSSIEMARWFGAAQAFKQLAPGVKINLKYCSISDYPTRIENYQSTYGHLPELMWGTEHVIEMFQKGYCADFNKIANVAESSYYDSYNEYFKTRFNIGGCQAGIPIAAEPWGVFVNLDILSDPTNPIILNPIQDGECSDEYKEWVDNFTWETFVDAVKRTNNDSHAGLSKIVEYFTSYSVESINDQFISTGTVDISSDEVRNTIKKLLEYENELSQYCVYQYDEKNGGSPQGAQVKEQYTGAAPWYGTRNFCEEQFCTFYAEAPWALPTIAQYVKARPGQDGIVKKVDFLPYPKVDASSEAYTGIAVEGLTVGNQCPIVDGEEVCYEKDSKLKEEVAAFFAMFAGLDPRAIAAREQIHYIFNDTEYVGDLTLPLIKRNYKYDWQYDEEILADFPDPAEGFEDNWQYQMSLWLKLYDLYLTNDEEPDVENFTNITYGLYKMLDSMYMLEGDYVTCLNYWNEPVKIDVDGVVEDIFNLWSGRFTKYRQQNDADGSYYGCIGTTSYVDTVLAELTNIQEKINKNSTAAWNYLADCVANYYYDENGDSLYPEVTDKSYRNYYEGSRYM